MSYDEMIAVIEAAKRGERIECKVKDAAALKLVRQTMCSCAGYHRNWTEPCNQPPMFSFGLFDYRVAKSE